MKIFQMAGTWGRPPIRMWVAAITLGLCPFSVLADDTHYDNTKAPHESPYKAEPPTGGHASLAAAATNPIGNLIQFQLQDQYNCSNHNSDGYSNSAILQPVIPIKLNSESVPLVVTRTTLPYVTTPDLGDPVGRKYGWGDLLAMGLFLPKLESKGIMVGLEPALSLPTATSDYTGSGKFSADPRPCISTAGPRAGSGARSAGTCGISWVMTTVARSTRPFFNPSWSSTSIKAGMPERWMCRAPTTGSTTTLHFL